MHQRNIFKIRPPNHEELAKKYPQLRKKCFVGANGKICIDFSSTEAVRSFTEILLSEYFELNVSIPKGVLVPRVPQRLNYLLLVEDLVNLNGLREEEIVGIDIGTGPLCIFSLLGASLNNWKFVSTDICNESLQTAKENLKNNSLEALVCLINVEDGSFFKKVFELPEYKSTIFAFSVCNPPFFDVSEAEKKFASIGDVSLQNLPNRSRGQPRSGTTAITEEIAYKGGEFNFICQMIEESQQHPLKTRIYTTMIGKRSTLKKLKFYMEKKKILKYKIFTLTQGRTFRWVLAWSFFENINLDLKENKF
uniref:U6 small nuclear RNA (adenine-(43)-N(6))-methyltransferase n=1 Tax=Meloidogyne incognita TaxID=6306 RepID=A0A914KJ24_MELIC